MGVPSAIRLAVLTQSDDSNTQQETALWLGCCLVAQDTLLVDWCRAAAAHRIL